MQGEEAKWAAQTFGTASLGDSRRTTRLISMAARAAEVPAGKVSQVFRTDRELQGA
jgi:hypothetical protein